MPKRPHILVTGSTGNLGKKAIQALTSRLCRVTCIGRNSNQQANVITADLKRFNSDWTKHFVGVDTVLHLAADPKPLATWESVQELNIDLSLNVIRAAQAHGVKRLVFASSNWVLGGYRFTDEHLSSSTPPRPTNPYGASKLFLERVGIEQAEHTGMSFLSLRIGYCQPQENRPGPHMAFGRWGQEMWLSDEDWCQAVECACLNSFNGAAIVNIMSLNTGMRWDLSEAQAAIGYSPVSQSDPRQNALGAAGEFAARLRDRFLPPMAGTPLFGKRW